MDMVDSELFAGALYELLQASFKSTVLNYMHSELDTRMVSQTRKKSAATLEVPTAEPVPAEEPRIAIVQLTTIFYQLQNSDMIQN